MKSFLIDAFVFGLLCLIPFSLWLYQCALYRACL